jgi:hypothetical protein
MKRKLLFVFALTAVFTNADAQCTFTVGNENPGFTTPASFTLNYILGTKYTVPVEGTLVSLNIFGLGTNSDFQMCVYEDNAGVPGNLITTSAAGIVTNGVIALPVTPVVLPAGEYWLMAIYNNSGGSSGHTYYTTSASTTVYYQSLVYGSPMPANASGFLNYTGQDFHYWMVLEGSNTSSTISPTACFSYTAPSGSVHTASETFVDIIPNTVGCDSLITINLTINNVNSSTTQTGANISSNAVGAAYQWLDCNNSFAVITGETSQTYFAAVDGSYAVSVTENGCTDTSACLIVNSAGLSSDHLLPISIHPNPTNGSISIMTSVFLEGISIKIVDVSGREISNEYFASGNTFDMNIEAEAGIYVVQMYDANGIIGRANFVKK